MSFCFLAISRSCVVVKVSRFSGSGVGIVSGSIRVVSGIGSVIGSTISVIGSDVGTGSGIGSGVVSCIGVWTVSGICSGVGFSRFCWFRLAVQPHAAKLIQGQTSKVRSRKL